MIYVVQALTDVDSRYSGLEDTKIFLFTDKEKAKNKIHELFCDAVNSYKEEIKDDLHIVFLEDYYEVNNGRDYFSGQIIKKEVV